MVFSAVACLGLNLGLRQTLVILAFCSPQAITCRRSATNKPADVRPGFEVLGCPKIIYPLEFTTEALPEQRECRARETLPRVKVGLWGMFAKSARFAALLIEHESVDLDICDVGSQIDRVPFLGEIESQRNRLSRGIVWPPRLPSPMPTTRSRVGGSANHPRAVVDTYPECRLMPAMGMISAMAYC